MTRTVNNLSKFLLLLTVLVPNAFGQTCVDTDHTTATGGNDPYSQGQVTAVSTSGVRTQQIDTCDPTGASLREYFCSSSKTITSALYKGNFGCLDGALVKEKGTPPACFSDIMGLLKNRPIKADTEGGCLCVAQHLMSRMAH